MSDRNPWSRLQSLFERSLRPHTEQAVAKRETPSRDALQPYAPAARSAGRELVEANRVVFGKGTPAELLRGSARAADAIAKRGGAPFSIQVKLDLTPLARALADVKLAGGAGAEGIARAMNETIDHFATVTKRDLQEWTGIKRQSRILEAFSKRRANAGHLVAALIVKDKHTVITAANFGARWDRSMPGGTHSAWNRPQMAVGSFMIFKGRTGADGKQAYGGGILFHRVGASRYPIKPVFGPNMAREMERHEGYVRRSLEIAVQTKFLPRAMHHLQREFERVKAANGL